MLPLSTSHYLYFYKGEIKMVTCLICNKQFKSRLGSHIRTHDITIKQYYDTYIRKENEGICPICGQETTFLGLTKGYSEHCSLICKGKDPKVKEKVENTCLDRYGATNVYASDYGKQKIKETCQIRYNADSPQQNKEIREKTENTIKEKYGGLGFESKEITNKIKQTNLDTYSNENPAKFGSEKYKNAISNIYGEDNPMKVPEIKEKAKNTCIEKYGYDNPAKNEKIKQKMHDTLWQNGGYTRAEDRCYLELIKLYPEAIRNYKSEKYPYKCDFYIPSEDLYIELNAFYMHGGHWYNENDPKDVAQVEKWRDQNTEQSLYAIHIWTESDIDKKKCAEENNLNYLVFWSEEEFIEWLKGEK